MCKKGSDGTIKWVDIVFELMVIYLPGLVIFNRSVNASYQPIPQD
jgi:hypothetical protein